MPSIGSRVVGAQRVIVVDAGTGAPLFEKNADHPGPVASTQKLLTALVIEAAGALEAPVTMGPGDRQCLQARLDLAPGDRCRRRELLAALLISSANDAAQALARDHAGSADAFADAMNRHAAVLGLTSSHFTNPTGLPDDRQHATARDMARVAQAVDRSPRLRELVAARRYRLTTAGGDVRELTNTNRLLGTTTPCDGMKTGFTKAAGWCLISSAGPPHGRRLVVALGATQEGVWRESQALLEWSLSH